MKLKSILNGFKHLACCVVIVIVSVDMMKAMVFRAFVVEDELACNGIIYRRRRHIFRHIYLNALTKDTLTLVCENVQRSTHMQISSSSNFTSANELCVSLYTFFFLHPFQSFWVSKFAPMLSQRLQILSTCMLY